MPYLHLRFSGDAPANRRAQLAERLTELTVSLLGKRRELTALTLEAVAPTHWFVGGAALSDGPHRAFQLDITVTDGSNSADEKARYITAVFAAMDELLGPLTPASYVVIRDVAGGAWGWQGRTQAWRREQALAL